MARPARAGSTAPDCCGAFLPDPDGNSVEAVHTERENPVPDGRADHLWIRVRDPAASKRFYTTIAPHAGLCIGIEEPDHVQLIGDNHRFSLIDAGQMWRCRQPALLLAGPGLSPPLQFRVPRRRSGRPASWTQISGSGRLAQCGFALRRGACEGA
jgi:hypothetical protein